MYDIVYLLVPVIWIVFVLYWLFSLLYEKVTGKSKPVQKTTYGRFSFWIIRVVLILIVVLFITRSSPGLLENMIMPYYAPLSIAGVLICACGIGFAIWARIHLGSNWSGTIVLKKGQTLVKTGPYSIVRHPIYTGILFGGMGTFLAVGSILTLLFAIGVLFFTLNRIRIEEKLMLGEFGKQYLQYQKETKKFIPFIY